MMFTLRGRNITGAIGVLLVATLAWPADLLAQQTASPQTRTLAQLEALALEHNPTLRMAEAEVRAAGGRERQAGLLPNPRVGYTAEELRSGEPRSGQHGFFVEQDIILGGKLGLERGVYAQELRMAGIEAEEQRLRVLNGVRLGYVQVLTAQETLARLRELAQLAAEAAETSRRLRSIGQADETEVLEAEIELEQAALAAEREQLRLDQLWTALAAVAGVPDLPPATLAGSLEDNAPQLDEAAILRNLLSESPAMRIAEANIDRAAAQVASSRRQAIPDLTVRGGLQHNRGLAEATGQSLGMQGFAEVGVQIPLFNRQQGSVQAAVAARDRAEQEKTRVRLVLRERAASVLQQYRHARSRVERYRKEILPRAQRADELMLARWGEMAAAYPQVLSARRLLLRSQTEYIGALSSLQVSALTLQGYLLVDGLEAPARPGEVDLPVREINIPTPRGAAGE